MSGARGGSGKATLISQIEPGVARTVAVTTTPRWAGVLRLRDDASGIAVAVAGVADGAETSEGPHAITAITEAQASDSIRTR
jgi:hypothetical protein